MAKKTTVNTTETIKISGEKTKIKNTAGENIAMAAGIVGGFLTGGLGWAYAGYKGCAMKNRKRLQRAAQEQAQAEAEANQATTVKKAKVSKTKVKNTEVKKTPVKKTTVKKATTAKKTNR